jgi:hypothetical protein
VQRALRPRATFPERDHMLWTILIIVLIVLVVMAVLGRGRFARR